ncbi:MAG TPA: ABC transporter permease, partial [Terriglobia bacterium]|nr:ABC transporter permease [Terriglobia bacterium]
MLWRRKRTQNDFSEELQAHLAHEADRLREEGMSEEEASAMALRNLGNITQTEERFYESHRWLWLDTLLQDLRFGLRQLRRNPGFTAVVVLSLALGIGANTAIFTVIDAVLLQSLPVKNPSQLVLLDSGSDQGTDSGSPYIGRWPALTFDAYQYFVRHNESFQGLAAFRKGIDPLEVRWPGAISGGQAEQAMAHLVSGNYFQVMGVDAAVGRVFGANDDVPNARPVAVISYDYWQRKFHGDPSAVGRAVDLNGTPFTIAGVTPLDFFGERMYETPPDYWLPLTFQPEIMQRESWLARKDMYWLNFIGRLKPGVTRAQAQAVLDVQLRQFLEAQTGTKHAADIKLAIKQSYIQLDPGRNGISRLRARYSMSLSILMGIVALVLLVACANVANLLFSRSAARQREISMRLVAGATRARLIRQMLTESVLLALFGGAAGLLMADWGVHLLGALLSRNLALSVTANPSVLLFTLAVSVLTGLVFGLVPALRASQTELSEAIKGATAAGKWSQSALTHGLVVLQVAVSLVLLAGAGLLARTLVNLEDQNLGFNRDNVLLVQTNPRLTGIKARGLDALYRQLLDSLNNLPGVRSATIAYYSPMSGHNSSTDVTVQGYTPRPNENMEVNENQVAPGYFETLGIPVLLGRPIGPQDTPTSPEVVVVNQAFADRFLHGQNPIGRRVWVGHSSSPSADLPQEIIGLVADARVHNAAQAPQPFAYMPLSQDPKFFAGNIEVRATGDPAGVAAEVRQAIREVDSALPIMRVQTLRRLVYDQLNQQRLVARLSVLFSLLALVLAAVGLYGVMAYWVARRTQEIGIRMALGAQKHDVLRLVVGRGLVMTLLGAGFGLGAALGLTRLMASSLYGVKANDPGTCIAASLLIVAVTLLACYIPARRATKVDP